MFTPTVTTSFLTSNSRPHSHHTLNPVTSTTSRPLSHLQRDEDPAVLTNSLTCGYIDGAWSSPVTCATGYSCNYYTTPTAAPNFGCCSEGDGCGYVSTCLDYTASGNSNTFGGVAIASSQFLCGSNYPYCSTLLLYGTTSSSRAAQSFLSYACQKGSGTTATAYQTTLQDTSSSTISTSASSTSVSSGSASSLSVSSSSASSVSTSSQASMVADTSASLSSAVPGSTQSASTSSSGNMSQGSQIGIGVGVGIGVAGMLVALVIWLLSRRRSRHTKLDDIRPRQSFAGHYFDPRSGRHADMSNYKFNRSVSQTTGKAGWDGVAAFELASTSRPHELPTNSR